MSALHERRDQIGVAEIETQLANLELKEPLTQTPEPPSPDTEVREDDETANPHIAQEKLRLTSAQDAWWFLCHGDRNGNRVGGAADLCDCTQAIEDLPVQHLLFYRFGYFHTLLENANTLRASPLSQMHLLRGRRRKFFMLSKYSSDCASQSTHAFVSLK